MINFEIPPKPPFQCRVPLILIRNIVHPTGMIPLFFCPVRTPLSHVEVNINNDELMMIKMIGITYYARYRRG